MLGRVESFLDGEGSDVLHGRAAVRDATELAGVADPANDLGSAHALGLFWWYRSQTAALDSRDTTDRDRAMRLLGTVYQAHPELVPYTLVAGFEQADADGRLPVSPVAQTYRGGLFLGEFEQTGDTLALTTALRRFRSALAATPPDDPERRGRQSNLSVILRIASEHTHDDAALLESVELGRAAVEGEQDPYDRAMYLGNLGAALSRLYTRTDDIGCLREGADAAREAIGMLPDGHPDRPRHLANLARTLEFLYARTGHVATLAESVEAARGAVAGLDPDSPDRDIALSNLANSLETLADRTADPALMDEAVDAGRAALAAHPEQGPKHASYLSGLGDLLLRRFQLNGDEASLHEAVQSARAALAMTSGDAVDRTRRLTTLSRSLHESFDHTDDLAFLTEAVEVQRTALAVAEPGAHDRATCLTDLGLFLVALGERTDAIAPLREAIDLLRQGLAATPADHPNLAIFRKSLGQALVAWFKRTGDVDALNEGLAEERAAVASFPADHAARHAFVHSLAVTLGEVFERTGDAAYLDESVSLHREAVRTTRPGDPFLPAELSSLGLALVTVFERNGDTQPLREALEAHRAAVAAIPPGHPTRPALVNGLASALSALSSRTGDTALLAEAVRLLREIVQACPDGHPYRTMSQYNLGLLLNTVASETGDTAALGEAIAARRAAIAATDDDDPLMAQHLSGLGNALVALSRDAGSPEALADAVDTLRAAKEATPPDHPGYAVRLFNLGSALSALYKRTADPGTLAEAERCYDEAARSESLALMERIGAYRALARLAPSGPNGHAGALAAVEAAAQLLPRAAARSLARHDREHLLSRLSAFPSRAAAVAVAAGRPERAVELLEQTRGILVADTVNARGGESARLHAEDPALAAAFDELQARLGALELAESREGGARTLATLADPARPGDAGRGETDRDRVRAQARRDAHAGWEDLLARIRARDGFASFLRPPDIRRLAAQAQDGPIVLVYTADTRCDALILSADADEPVRAVPLPNLTTDDVLERADLLLKACGTAPYRDLEPEQPPGRADVHEILAWLWDVVAGPVLEALGHTSTPDHPEREESWKRVWWCPIGPLAYLPLHAAGHHADTLSAATPNPRTVMDRVISSYTATVRSLAAGRAGTGGPRDAGSAVVVAVPDAPGADPLPGAAREARLLGALLKPVDVLPDPTRESVLDALPRHTVAHFACHGATNWADPASSHLVLRDREKPLTVADVSSLSLGAGLAYLSACSTTVPNPELADEAVHVTGAFHLAGYRHVVGTLWSADDTAAVETAELFYAGLLQPRGRLAVDRSAFALHQATRAMRARHPRDPSFWAGYTHTGA